MKRMKIVVMMAAFLLTAGIAMAQQAAPQPDSRQMGTPAERAQKMVDRMKGQLGLSDDQCKQLQMIYTNSFTKQDALMAQIKQLNDARETDVNNALTAEQQQKLADAKQRMMQRQGQGMGQGGQGMGRGGNWGGDGTGN